MLFTLMIMTTFLNIQDKYKIDTKISIEAGKNNSNNSNDINILKKTNNLLQESKNLSRLNKILSKEINIFTKSLRDSGRDDLLDAYNIQQNEWLVLRDKLCYNLASSRMDQINCLSRFYSQRIEALRRGFGNDPITTTNWKHQLLPGEQIGIGGASGSDYLAIAQCGITSMILSPGGILTTTDRSQLASSNESLELPSPVGGLDVKGEWNETQVECRWSSGTVVTVEVHNARSNIISGPCAGTFGSVMNIKIGERIVINERDLVGYCNSAILASINIDKSSVKICTLSSEDDPDRADEITALPKTRQCSSTPVK